MPYIGNQPGTGVRNRFIYTATASQTTFSGADNNGKTLKYADSDFVDVFLNGVCLVPAVDYTSTTKTSVVLTQAASLNDTLEVVAYDIATIADTVSKADGGTFEGDLGITSASPDIILTNNTTEDTDGGRESTISFKGLQSGGEESTLAEIRASHDATADDQKGDLIFKTNDGSDGFSPTERVRIDSNGSILTATLGTDNVHLGEGAGESIASGGNNNTLIGHDAGKSITTGTVNTFVGNLAGDAVTTSHHNTGVGHQALTTNVLGSNSVAVGSFALNTQNPASAADMLNTAVGYNAGALITTGAENTIVGGEAGDALSVGNGNVAVGVQALTSNVNGSRNTAVGTTALKQAEASGSTSSNTYNCAFGYGAGLDLTTGDFNTFVGGFAASSATTAHSNICIGYGAQTGSVSSINAITLGINITSSSNDFSFGKASNVVKNDFDTDANWSRSSDERLKKNIADQKLGLDFINDLRTVKYNWKASHELDSTDSQLSHLYKEDEADNEMNTDATMHNFIAQEVKAALDTAGVSDFSGWSEDQYGVQQVSREMFVIPLVKAVQELSAKVDALETENTAIKARLDALEAE